MKVFYSSVVLILLIFGCSTTNNSRLETILQDGSPAFRSVLQEPRHEVQIVYGEVSGDSIIHHTYGTKGSTYFYPASTVKMMVAFAAMEYLSGIDSMGVTAQIAIDSSEHHPRRLTYDSLFDGAITIDHLLQKIFVYSDNQAYNILYGWLGKDYVNGLYTSLGLDTRIIHQLSETAFSFSEEANTTTTKVELMSDNTAHSKAARTVSFLPTTQSWESSQTPLSQQKGKGYIDSKGSLVKEPFNFESKNYVPLGSLLGALERVVSPEAFSASERFEMSDEHRSALLDIMALLPEDLPAPVDTLPNNYVKFFIHGDEEKRAIPKSLQIRNKVGWAYGYLTDVAYVEDLDREVSFFLAASIHVNKNEVYNDGIYEYEEVGIPFLAELGRLVYQAELQKQQ